MKKQFNNINELHAFVNDMNTTNELWGVNEPTADEIIVELEKNGYDLHNLTADGHAYQIGSFTNNGWIYEDEADVEYIKETGSNIELRKR